MKNESNLDETDLRLLRAVQRDAGSSQAELAERAGISASQVSRRLAKLRADGVLRGIVGVIEPARVGFTCEAFVRVRMKDHSEENVRLFRDLLSRLREVTLCVALTGEADFLLKLVTRDLPHLQLIVQSKLLRCPAVAHLESSIVLECLKDSIEVPL